MARMASGKVIESFGEFLRRSTALSDEHIRGWTKDFAEGRVRMPDASSEAFGRAQVRVDETTRTPKGESPPASLAPRPRWFNTASPGNPGNARSEGKRPRLHRGKCGDQSAPLR